MAADVILKNRKSPYFSNCLTNCHKIWHGDSSWSSWTLTEVFKIQDGGGRHFEKSKNRRLTDRHHAYTFYLPNKTANIIKQLESVSLNCKSHHSETLAFTTKRNWFQFCSVINIISPGHCFTACCYFAASRDAKYRDLCVCVCECVCLSLCRLPCLINHMSKLRRNSVHVTCGCGLILLWWQCNTLCTSGFVDDVRFSRNGPYGAWH